MSAQLLPDLLQRQADLRPEVPALVSGGGAALSYRDWWARSRSCAAGLARVGVLPGDRVAVIGSNGSYQDIGVAYMAVLLAGAVVLPLSGTQAVLELEESISRARAAVAVTCGIRVPAALGATTIACLELEAGGTSEPQGSPLRINAPAELLSTSGTTGLPRLVEASHGNLVRDYDAEPWLEPEPYYFLHALTLGTNVGQVALRSSLTLGYTVVALEVFDLEPYIALAEALPMRETLLVPAMATTLAAEAARKQWVLPDVEIVAVSGAATPPATWRRLTSVFPNAQFVNTYTTTEAWPARVTTVVDPERVMSVGRPVDDQAVEIRDDTGSPLGAFERGTIHLSHRAAPARHYVEGSATARISRGGWVETDDIGYLDAEGFLYVEDRKSDVITTGGHTVSTVEVEHVLADHPHVVEAAAFGLPHRVLGEFVAACVVGSADLDLDDLGRSARARLAAHKVPRLLRRVDALPRTRSGKVAKRVLREEFDATASRRPAACVATPDEALIRAIWEQVLEQSALPIDQPYFTLGGDSLSALRIVSRIRSEFSEDVSAASLLKASTIADQAAIVADARRTA